MPSPSGNVLRCTNEKILARKRDCPECSRSGRETPDDISWCGTDSPSSSGGLPTHPGLLLDAPQWPSESSQGNHLLFFRFAQDVAHIDEGYMPHAEINVPDLILVGRFSGDPLAGFG